MSTDLLLKMLKEIDKQRDSLEGKLPWKARFRRRYLTGRMFWATQIADTYGGVKMAFLLYLAMGKQVFLTLATEYSWLVNPVKNLSESVVDFWKVGVQFFHDVV